MNFEDLHSALQVRHSELNLPIKTTRSSQCWVKGVRSICCHQHLNISSGFETIKLVDDFKHSSLHFTISVSKSGSTNSIDFIKENDATLFLTSHLEDLSHHSGSFSNVPLDKLRPNNSDKAGISSVSDSSGSESLSSSWWSIEKNTLRRVYSQSNESLRVQ